MFTLLGVVGVDEDVTQMLIAKEAADSLAKEFMNLVENANAPIIGVGASMEVLLNTVLQRGWASYTVVFQETRKFQNFLFLLHPIETPVKLLMA